jgi:hypothetical protein
MDLSEACDILESLAEGIDPHTGDALSDESPYNHPRVIRALYSALLALQTSVPGSRAKQELPANAGKPWGETEDGQLLAAFDAGSRINDLAKLHHRTRGAIQSRLIRLGRLVPGTSDTPNLTLQRPRPVAEPFRDVDGRSGGPVR